MGVKREEEKGKGREREGTWLNNALNRAQMRQMFNMKVSSSPLVMCPGSASHSRPPVIHGERHTQPHFRSLHPSHWDKFSLRHFFKKYLKIVKKWPGGRFLWRKGDQRLVHLYRQLWGAGGHVLGGKSLDEGKGGGGQEVPGLQESMAAIEGRKKEGEDEGGKLGVLHGGAATKFQGAPSFS